MSAFSPSRVTMLGSNRRSECVRVIWYGLGERSRTSTVIAPNDVACQLADTQKKEVVRMARFERANLPLPKREL